MSNIEKIRQEIERLKKWSESSKKEWIDEGYNQNAFAEDCRIKSFDKLLSLIDSLPEEKPSEDLEEVVRLYADNQIPTDYPDYFCRQDVKDAFIAGAEWQKEQMPIPEDTVLFQKGVEEGRRLEKDDLTLTWEDMVLLRTLFDATDANQSMGALTVQPMTREYYEYLLREFNEQRKK